KRNEKIITHLKEYSQNKNLVLIGFKLTNTQNENERIDAVEKLFQDAKCDHVVLNDKSDRDEKDQQKNFSVFTQPEKFDTCQTAEEVAKKIESLILNMNKLKAESGK
ncbi:MAG: phosphopantothenoylcysteine decarboxylase, partial [Ignavibacteria bacterium]|nr:phosphopantothenoylcysteine decarboxylase [Ignavibacteria bacterium]